MPVITGNKSPYDLQVARAIEVRIKRGIYKPGERLPSVRTLGREFSVSLNVIQRAIRRLEKEMIVVSHAGKGVEVVQDCPALRSAILFGFIQPYPSTMYFERQVLLYAEQAFSSRDNLMVVRSSERSAKREVEVAEHFLHNGVQGILLWCTDHSGNAHYFESIAKEVPVVLVDRVMPECDLPAVVIDSAGTGAALVKTMFEQYQRQRLLVLLDNLDISPYRELVSSINIAAAAMGRSDDVTLIHMPISDHIHDWNRGDFTSIQQQHDIIARQLTEGGYDALFCPQEDFVDYAIVQTGIADQFPGLQLGTTTGPDVNARSIRYNQSGTHRWVLDFPRMIQTAADILQDSVVECKVQTGVTRIPVYAHGDQ